MEKNRSFEDKLFWFLRPQADLPMELRRAIWHRHSGRWPQFLARYLRRDVNQIIEIATWRNPPIGCKKHVVIRWFWNNAGVGMIWRECGTLREAKEHTFSIDHAHAILERSGLRPD